MLRNGTCPALNSTSSLSVTVCSGPLVLAIGNQALGGGSRLQGKIQQLQKLRPVPLRHLVAAIQQCLRQNAKTSISVTPGSLLLKFVHSGV